MIAVIFEVTPREGRQDDYLAAAEGLRIHLQRIDGFLSIERFASLSQPDKLLSLSFWRDEAAVARWRKLDAHRAAQMQGRADIFHDYRARVAEIVRDYGLYDRAQAPLDSRDAHG
ncbi:MAG: antibiotic biosynthesis monooxygenase [Thiomonas sp.]|uniref:antibiotic biosynthesis monooxygenase family protein n=1 Tax=Thiomonas sp. TaxID=2047785 RepID=UPI002A35AC77|nr:antibiotic biosynthesis monooxygenase [Thiomonas sp.]MDY0329205.1 antibiotic biosynthesis monooxygenase [Thiomonas sp.]